MSDMIVDVSALNFRSAPETTPGSLAGTVFLGQKLSEVRKANVEGWVQCKANVSGVTRDGFVAGRFLRKPLNSTREALVESVHTQWMRFRRGTGKEHVAPFAGFVGEMWQAIGINLDGTDKDQPWSAACISFVVRQAGIKYGGFKFAAAHSKYIHHAIQARFSEDRSVPFWGFDLHERKPQVGDIICKDNPTFPPNVDFNIAGHQDAYRSHCDIIMQIDSPRQKLLAIGGNVSDSVSITEYDLAPGDLLAATNHVFALLANMTDAA